MTNPKSMVWFLILPVYHDLDMEELKLLKAQIRLSSY